ncbi:MAG TPA: flavin reductase [Desulfuromonadales bacterium]|nr:flavin reductase [Desulfuromonadales bacterium]
MPQCSRAFGLSFLPVPSALVTFRSPDGKVRVHSVGWLGVVCDNPPLLTVCLRPGVDDQKVLRAGDRFFVNLPNEELMQALAGPMWPGRDADPATAGRSPLSLLVGEERGVPLVAACPVRIECRCRSLKARFGQRRLSGEVLAVHLDGRRQELAAPVDFCRLMPLQRRHFQGLGADLQSRDVS